MKKIVSRLRRGKKLLKTGGGGKNAEISANQDKPEE